ncbi:MAG: DNA polymerase III subunit alpha, partial [Alphaproteobacteria bacterium]
LLRRAMGKKIKEEMDRQRARFVEGAVERGVERAKADWIFDLVAKFAGYGFNKSHAAAYALVAYQTAYMKANHPVEFMAATMSLDMHNTDKLAHFAHELDQMGIPLLPPDINRSGVAFRVEECTAGEGGPRLGIRYALAAIKGVGEKAMEEVVRVREEGGVFRSLTDFAERIDPHVLNRRQLEQLAAAGAFDALEPDRARVFAAAERILRHAGEAHAARTSTQSSLFGADSGVALPELRLPDVARWSKVETLSREQAAVGFYLSAHPLDAYEKLLRRLRVRRAADVLHGDTPDGAELRMAGIIENYYERRARKSGRRFGVLELSDPSGSFEVLVFEEQLPVARSLVEGEVPILAEVEARLRDDEVRLSARSLVDLDLRAQETGAGLEIRFSSIEVVAPLADRLAAAHGGRGTVYGFVLLEGGEEAVIELGRDFRVTPRLVDELKTLSGIWEVEEL